MDGKCGMENLWKMYCLTGSVFNISISKNKIIRCLLKNICNNINNFHIEIIQREQKIKGYEKYHKFYKKNII